MKFILQSTLRKNHSDTEHVYGFTSIQNGLIALSQEICGKQKEIDAKCVAKGSRTAQTSCAKDIEPMKSFTAGVRELTVRSVS